MNAAESYYVGSPAVDYLTVGTWDRAEWQLLRGLVAGASDGGLKDSSWMQYQGETEQSGHYFAGAATQGGRDHYIVRTSGARAHEFAKLTQEARGAFPRAKATRCDVQISVLPSSASLRLGDLGVMLEKRELGAFRGERARWRKIKTVRGDDGLDTIYIGSRESGRFLRIYAKEIADRVYIRFEVEFKAELAIKAWAAMLNDGERGLGELLAGEFDMLPAGFCDALPTVATALHDFDSQRLQLVAGVPTWERQLKWIRKQVHPTLEKLLSSPARDDLRDILKDLLDNY